MSRSASSSALFAKATSCLFSKNGAILGLILIVIYQQVLLSSGKSGYGRASGPLISTTEFQSKDPLAGPDDGDDNIYEGNKVDEVSESSHVEPSDGEMDDYAAVSTPYGKDEETSSASTTTPKKGQTTKGGSITIITGTHTSVRSLAVDEQKQHPACEKIADALHMMWTASYVHGYARWKAMVKAALRAVAAAGANCTLAGSRKFHMMWTFPMSWRPDEPCAPQMKHVITSKSYIRDKTRVHVNWFLLRPDLVTFNNVASVENVDVHIAVMVAPDVASAAFSKEGCPRFNTILEKKDVYKQRLLLVALSDMQYQLERIRRGTSHIYVCQGTTGVPRDKADETALAAVLGSSASFSVKEDGCEIPALDVKLVDKTHVGSMLRMSIFQGPNAPKVQKTVFTGPRVVFVAGLEGVGHHLFSVLGHKHSVQPLYEAFKEYVGDAAWDDDSLVKYGPKRQNVVQVAHNLKDDISLLQKNGSNPFFLNTVYATTDVNMFSFPWGGPRCYLKLYGRVVCNIDIIELCRIAEEAGIDFRIILLKRSIGAAVVSSSIHRPFGTLVAETRILALSWALLKSGIDTVDSRFTLEINYEDMINHPADSTAKLADHLGFDKTHPLYAHMEQTLTQSGIDHPVGDGSRWKEEVDLGQMQFMSDVLGL